MGPEPTSPHCMLYPLCLQFSFYAYRDDYEYFRVSGYFERLRGSTQDFSDGGDPHLRYMALLFFWKVAISLSGGVIPVVGKGKRVGGAIEGACGRFLFVYVPWGPLLCSFISRVRLFSAGIGDTICLSLLYAIYGVV